MQVESPVQPQTQGGERRMTSVRSPIRVRNLMANVTVFTKSVNGDNLRIIFGAAGQPNDTQRVPLALAEDIDFLNALEQGTLEIVSGPPDVMEALQFETEQVRAEREEREARNTAMVERRQDNDMVGLTCLGPAPAGRSGKCGKGVLQRASQQATTPPLCPQHVNLAPTFSLFEDGSKGDTDSGAREGSAGTVRREWRQATIMPTQKVDG